MSRVLLHDPLGVHPNSEECSEVPTQSVAAPLPETPALQRISETTNQPKEEVFGQTSLRSSSQKLRSGPPNPGKQKKQAFWNGHAGRTSTKELRSEKLRADFSLQKKTQEGVRTRHCSTFAFERLPVNSDRCYQVMPLLLVPK